MNKLDEALDKYYERFGKKYPLSICQIRTTDEIVADIEFCINTGCKAKEPIYEENIDY